jgi:hypothetical protein
MQAAIVRPSGRRPIAGALFLVFAGAVVAASPGRAQHTDWPGAYDTPAPRERRPPVPRPTADRVGTAAAAGQKTAALKASAAPATPAAPSARPAVDVSALPELDPPTPADARRGSEV